MANWPGVICSASRGLVLVSLLFLAELRAADAERLPAELGEVELTFKSPEVPTEAMRAIVRSWATQAARAVVVYHGKFPVDSARVEIAFQDGRRVSHGQAAGWHGPRVTIALGREATNEDLADDWMLTHELLHLCFPSVPRRQHWLEEGLSTYVEPVARARARMISAERFWGDLVEGLPQGQPRANDRGLDRTATWGRTYWGGALYCFRVDLETRRRTANRRGLEHALRAIVAAGGTIEQEWSIDQVIKVGDAATGVPVMRQIYDEMKETPITVDLDALWRELGVVRTSGGYLLDQAAPLADVRMAITRADPGQAK